MKFKVLAELQGQSQLIRGINYTIFTKEFEVTIPEKTLVDRAFNRQWSPLSIEHNGIDLIVCGCYNMQLKAVGIVERCQSSSRVFERLQELGWKFWQKPAQKMRLPQTVIPNGDRFIWERLSA